MKQSLAEKWRLIWAITLKDLIDAIKNKNIIAIFLSSLFIVVIYKYLPGLTAEDGPPSLLVYAAGESKLLVGLEDSSAVDLYIYESAEDMKYYLTNGEEPELGLEIPSGFDDSLGSGETLDLRGYVLDLFNENEVYDLRRYMENEFEYIIGQPVTISIEKVPLGPETYGMTVLPSMGFVFVTLMVGMMVIPHMMIEEKQLKTLDVLLVSPAGSGQIVIAKSLTGLIYSLVMLVVALAFNHELIQHGWLFLLGGFLGALFAISLGILLGLLIDSRQQLTLWAWAAFIPLFLPMMLVLMDDLFSPTIINIFRLVPSSALFRIFRSTMGDSLLLKYFLPQLTLLVIVSGFLLATDAWVMRRLDR